MKVASIAECAKGYGYGGWRIFPLHTRYPDGSCSCRSQDCIKDEKQGKHPRDFGILKRPSSAVCFGPPR